MKKCTRCGREDNVIMLTLPISKYTGEGGQFNVDIFEYVLQEMPLCNTCLEKLADKIAYWMIVD